MFVLCGNECMDDLCDVVDDDVLKFCCGFFFFIMGVFEALKSDRFVVDV